MTFLNPKMTKIWMFVWPKKVLGCQQTESEFYLGYKWQGKAIQTKARQGEGWVKATKESQINQIKTIINPQG